MLSRQASGVSFTGGSCVLEETTKVLKKRLSDHRRASLTLVLLLVLRVAIFRLFLLFGFIALLIDCSGGLAGCAVARRLELINSRHFTRRLALAEVALVVAAGCKKSRKENFRVWWKSVWGN